MSKKSNAKITTFLNDADGITITDYICIIITAIYIILMLVCIGFSLMHSANMYEIRFESLKDLLGILDDPVKILLTAYFINGFTTVLKGNKTTANEVVLEDTNNQQNN